jgi:hypothetical protein
MNAEGPEEEQYSEGKPRNTLFHASILQLPAVTQALITHWLLHVVLTLPFCTSNTYLFKLISFRKYNFKVQQVGSLYVAKMNDVAYNTTTTTTNNNNNNNNNNSVA